MKIIKKKKKNKVVFVSMCVDGLHHGHINILKKANKFGKVVVGLMTDTGIKSYKKRKPKITFKNRKKILDEIKLVNKVVPINNLDFSSIAKKYKVDIWVHGDDWKKGPQSSERQRLIVNLKKRGGKIIDIPYTKNISSSSLFKHSD